MTWTDRIKKSIETFKRMALPLFGFYILFALVGIIVAVVSVGAALFPLLRMEGLGATFSAVPYMDPNIPVPPGYGPSMNYGYGLDELAPYLDMAPTFIVSFVLLMLVSWVLASVFQAGVFHLTKKAYVEKAQFRDIRLKGFPRLLGWYGIIAIIGIILVGLGVLIALSFQSEYAMALFGAAYLLALVAAGFFLAPWVSAAPYTMLNQPHLSFWQAFKESWRFYRRHMGPLWGVFLTVLGIQLLISLINRSAPDIGLIVSLITSPFVAILPIVWVLTLVDEDQPLPIGNIYSPTTEQGTYGTEVNVDPVSEVHHKNEPDLSDYPSTQPDASPEISPYSTPSTPPTTPPYTPPSAMGGSAPLYTPPKNPYPTEESPDHIPYTAPYGHSTAESEQDLVNFCPTCGKKVREGASYCSQCGTKL